MFWFLVLTAVEVLGIALPLYKLLIFIFEKRGKKMRYKFCFRYKEYNNELHDYPVILTATNDLTAYRLAILSFLDRIEYLEKALHIKFAAPENLTIIMRKELP